MESYIELEPRDRRLKEFLEGDEMRGGSLILRSEDGQKDVDNF